MRLKLTSAPFKALTVKVGSNYDCKTCCLDINQNHLDTSLDLNNLNDIHLFWREYDYGHFIDILVKLQGAMSWQTVMLPWNIVFMTYII